MYLDNRKLMKINRDPVQNEKKEDGTSIPFHSIQNYRRVTGNFIQKKFLQARKIESNIGSVYAHEKSPSLSIYFDVTTN